MDEAKKALETRPSPVRPWPRMMKRATAAAYCDMSIPSFEREILADRLPAGVVFGGSVHWSQPALDKALDIISGEAAADWRAKSGLYGKVA